MSNNTPMPQQISGGVDSTTPAHEIPGDVPPPTDTSGVEEWKHLEPQELLAELQKEYTDKARLDAQIELDKAVKEYFDDLTKRWKEEMDTLLVYAGLFSAVLTAFNVESYKLLRPDPMDETVLALRQLSQQLNSFSINHPFVNSTKPATQTDATTASAPFLAPPPIVSINTLWFSSLVLSLASASLALLVKQWLYEITSGIPSTSREGAQLRQHRLDSLNRWHLSTIIKILPIMLQLALILFLTGLVILLWSLQKTVAIVTSVLTAALFIFLIAVTILPIFEWHCCYRSPQSYVVYTCLRPIRNQVVSLARQLARQGALFCMRYASNKDVLGRWWGAQLSLCGLFSRPLPYRSWETQERSHLINSVFASSLNVATAIRACDATLDATCLERMRIALTAEPGAPVMHCLSALGMKANDDATSVRMKLLVRDAPDSIAPVVRLALRQMLAIDRPQRKPEWEEDLQALLQYSTFAVDGSTDNRMLQDDQALRTNFLIAIEASSVDNQYAALRFLAMAVRVKTPTGGCRYATVVRVLSAAEQWIRKKRSRSDVTTRSRNAPPVYMLAFTIVARCTLLLVTGETTNPAPQDARLAQQCEDAKNTLDLLSDFLPDMVILTEDSSDSHSLCNELAWGAVLFLRPLTRLAAANPEIVSDKVANALKLYSDAVIPFLIPWVQPDPNSEGQGPVPPVTERLDELKQNLAQCFDTFGMGLSME